MAYHDTHAAPAHQFVDRFISALKSFFAAIGTGLISVAEANRRMHLVERLQHKSDAELAALGMKREDIVRRVFIDMLDV
ncbi:MAG: DUF1127 domain-containing protein [Roseobacter sp.]